MTISDFLTGSGAFILWTPPKLHHKVANYVRTCTLLPKQERRAYNQLNLRHRTSVNIALLPGQVSTGVRYLPTGNRKPFEKAVKTWAKNWRAFVTRISQTWQSVTAYAWEDAFEAVKIRYQRDPKRDEIPLDLYVKNMRDSFNTAAGRGPSYQHMEYTYIEIVPLVVSRLCPREAKTFDSLAHRWLIESHRLAGEHLHRYTTKIEGLMQRAASVSGTVFTTRRYHREPDLTHLACLAAWLDFFNLDKAASSMARILAWVSDYKEKYYHSTPEQFRSAQGDLVVLLKKVAVAFGEIAAEFDRQLDTDALEPRGKRWLTA